jgi:hypothetical protein
VQTVIFHEPKVGAPEWEWEDCAGHADTDPLTGRPLRLVAVDGATEAYDSIRWVGQLVGSFLGPEGPSVRRRDEIDAWFGRMQRRWVDEGPAQFASFFEARKFQDSGSFATFLGCELHEVGRAEPRWYAAALGDTVLFHIRDGHLLAQLPALSARDFGLNPDGVSTQPAQRERMSQRLCFGDGRLRVGDLLFLATDAVAACLIGAVAAGRDCWTELSAVEHPREFRRWVAHRRHSGEMKNDDVTLLRAEITPAAPEVLVVCR